MTDGAFLGAAAFAASAGVATFFAPCAFPLLPGYVGLFLQRSEGARPGVAAAGAAAVGSLGVLGVVAGLAYAFGGALTSALPVFEPVVGVGLVAVGLLTLRGRAPSLAVSLPARPESVGGFAVFGGAYAVAAAGCVGPLVLGVFAQAVTLPAEQAAAVVGVYAGAATAPLVGVTLLASVGVDSWRRAGRYAGQVERVAGAVMVAAGLGQLYLSARIFGVL